MRRRPPSVTARNPIAGQVAIPGLGHTRQGGLPGIAHEENAVDAARQALADRGLGPGELDGLIACNSVQDLGNDVNVGQLSGGVNLPYVQSLDYGACNFPLHRAVMAIAGTILLTYGANACSSKFDFGKPMYGADMASAAGLVHIAGRAGVRGEHNPENLLRPWLRDSALAIWAHRSRARRSTRS